MNKVVATLLRDEMSNLIHFIYLNKRRLDKRNPFCIQVPINRNGRPYAKYHFLYIPSEFTDAENNRYYECRIVCEVSTVKVNIDVVFYNPDTQYMFNDPMCTLYTVEEGVAALCALLAPIPIPDIILSPTQNNVKLFRYYTDGYNEVYIDELKHDNTGNIAIVVGHHDDALTSFPLLSHNTVFEYFNNCPDDNKPEENNESEDN